MTDALVPGSRLGGRYVLEDLLEEIAGARFWRARDTVLARNVAVHIVDETDPRADRVLEAARVSAGVVDPHFLRVLDADVRDGHAWVINEWGSGTSLDILVADRVLPPDRAAWLVREVASAISVAHAHEIAHGHLNPENVMVTESGTVRIIGFCIDASLRPTLRTGNYPSADAFQADVYDLAGLLYAALVGRWPGASTSHVPEAPRDAHGPLRPRQVRPGVIRELDAVCDRVLSRQHNTRTAHQMTAVLSEYIGDPTVADPAIAPALNRTPAPADSPESSAPAGEADSREGSPDPGLLEETAVSTAPPTDPVLADPVLADPPQHRAPSFELTEDDSPWPEESGEPAAAPAHREPRPDEGVGQDPVDPEATRQVAVVFTGEVPAQRLDQESTQASEIDDFSWTRPSGEPAPPAPDLEPVPERPLFAPEGTTRRPKPGHEQLAEHARTPSWVQHNEQHDTGVGTGPGTGLGTGVGLTTTGTGTIWPFGEDPEREPDDWEERTSRPWLRLPLVITVLVVVGILAAFLVTWQTKRDSGDASGEPTPRTETSAQPSGQPIRIRSVDDFDPFGDPAEENPQQVRFAIDDDPGTAWETSTYRRRPDLGGLKPGVGLILDLGSVQRVGSVAVDLVGSPTNLTLYAAPTALGKPAQLDGLRQIAVKEGAGEQVVLNPRSAVRTRYLVVWLTSLPAVGDGFRGGIATVSVRS